MLVEGAMFAYLLKLLLIARTRLKSRASLEAENLVLRQQVIVLSRKSASQVRLRNIDRLIFAWLSPQVAQSELMDWRDTYNNAWRVRPAALAPCSHT